MPHSAASNFHHHAEGSCPLILGTMSICWQAHATNKQPATKKLGLSPLSFGIHATAASSPPTSVWDTLEHSTPGNTGLWATLNTLDTGQHPTPAEGFSLEPSPRRRAAQTPAGCAARSGRIRPRWCPPGCGNATRLL